MKPPEVPTKEVRAVMRRHAERAADGRGWWARGRTVETKVTTSLMRRQGDAMLVLLDEIDRQEGQHDFWHQQALSFASEAAKFEAKVKQLEAVVEAAQKEHSGHNPHCPTCVAVRALELLDD